MILKQVVGEFTKQYRFPTSAGFSLRSFFLFHPHIDFLFKLLYSVHALPKNRTADDTRQFSRLCLCERAPTTHLTHTNFSLRRTEVRVSHTLREVIDFLQLFRIIHWYEHGNFHVRSRKVSHIVARARQIIQKLNFDSTMFICKSTTRFL